LLPVRKKVTSVPQDASVLDAFKVMNKENYSSVAVLDHQGTVVANFSLTDIKYLLKLDKLDLLHKNLKEAIQQIRLEKDRENEYKSQMPVFTVTRDTSLKRAVGKLLATKSHRLWIVKDSIDHHPVGVLSLSDLLHILTPKQSAKHWSKHPLIDFVPAI